MPVDNQFKILAISTNLDLSSNHTIDRIYGYVATPKTGSTLLAVGRTIFTGLTMNRGEKINFIKQMIPRLEDDTLHRVYQAILDD